MTLLDWLLDSDPAIRRQVLRLGLNPVDWTKLVEATGDPAPHINEILKAGFRIATSAVVLDSGL
jgi:hypothetical protein